MDIEKYIGKTIKSIDLNVELDYLSITFTDGIRIKIYDDVQMCCENRYMNTDDDLNDLVGQKLVNIEMKDCIDIGDDYTAHDINFMEIQCDMGFVTIANHNVNNGYYCEFNIIIREDRHE